MLVYLTPIISHGIIDNTRRGVIDLTLWRLRDEEPLHLQLSGNCLQDIAGCRVSFRCGKQQPPPSVKRLLPLYKLAAGLRREEASVQAGDITLSRRAPSQHARGKVANLLSIELFADVSVRLMIECEDFSYELSLPEWECSSACASAQQLQNMTLLRDHVLANVAAYRGPALTHAGEDMPPCRWDSILNRAEACMVIIPSIHDKYAAEPRGLLAEYFAMDRPELLGRVAEAEEHGQPCDLSSPKCGWEILDFVPGGEEKRLATAMEHPLFAATAHLSGIVQRYIISDIDHYRHSSEVDTLLSQLAGTISQVLGTILVAQDEGDTAELALARADVLATRLEKMKNYHRALRPKASEPFLEGLSDLITELRHFVCTLRP